METIRPWHDLPHLEDFDRCYRAVQARDARFDGWFFTAVSSTGIYCRPSCPARTPKRENVSFYATPAGAQQAGFRACLRCRPDAAPGSPEWMGRADVAARAVRLILDGIVDREGVSGLARALGYSERHLNRLLMAEIGTGPLALARAQRAQTARILLQTTEIPITDVAFGAGFTSVRQFNETIRAVFGRTPTALRKRGGRQSGTDLAGGQAISVRLAHRLPFAAEPLFDYLGRRAVPGLESYDESVYSRSLELPGGGGSVVLTTQGARAGEIRAIFQLDELPDLTTAISRCRRLLNLDADPVAVDDAFSADPLLGGLVRQTPGIRVAGAADGFELAVRAIVGQQVSVTGARSILGRLVRAIGEPLQNPLGTVTHRFPTPVALASGARKRPRAFAMPTARRLAIAALAEAVAGDEIAINPGTDSEELQRKLVGLPGIGPWTASYVAMRALADPDAFPAADLGIQRAIERLGAPSDPRSVKTIAERWRPWRAYAAAHLWLADRPT